MKAYPFIFLLLLLVSCSSAQPASTPTPAGAVPTHLVEFSTYTPAPTRTKIATPAPTASPTLAPDSLYPFTMDGLRERSYPGGKILIYNQLSETDFYTRYFIGYPSDGLTITGILQIPPGDGPFPVIVLNHGYFNRWSYSSGDGTDRLAETLNRAGYLTVSSDYRSWGGSDMGLSLFYSGPVIDVMNLLASLSSIPQADTRRVGMLGHSMGGGVTAKVLTLDGGERIRAAIFYAPVSADDADIVARWGTGCLGTANLAECYSTDILPETTLPSLVSAYLEAVKTPQIFTLTSPIYHLDLVNAPVQIHIGSADGRDIAGVPPAWSQTLYDALTQAGKPAELFTYKGQGHSFIGASRELFLTRMVAFFDLYVKNAGQ